MNNGMAHLNILLIGFTICLTLSFCACQQNKTCVISLIIGSEKELNISGIDAIRADAGFRAYLGGKSCLINMTKVYMDVESRVTAVSNQFAIYIVFACVDHTRVEFVMNQLNDTYDSRFMLRLIFKIYCIVTLDTLTKLSLSKLSIITDLYIQQDQLIGGYNQACVFASTLRTLDISLDNPGFLNICRDNFTSVYALNLRSTRRQILSSNIIRSLEMRFPNLQQFRMINLVPEERVVFPWTNLEARIGDDNARDIHFVTVSNNTEHIPNNHVSHTYARWFNYAMTQENKGITHNLMSDDLFHFNGSIMEIVISGLLLKSFKSDCFSRTHKLNTLTLSNNNLQIIKRGQFSGLSKLIRLDVSNNNLEGLNTDVFEDLVSLLVLDLSRNRLTKLQNSLLRNCKSLEQIRLGHNQLKILTDQFFKPIFFTLRSANLAFNPLHLLPAVLLYAPNIYNIDMHNTLVNGQSLMYLIAHLDDPDTDIRDTMKSFNEIEKTPQLIIRTLDFSFCQIRSLLDPVSFYAVGGNQVLLGIHKLMHFFYINFYGNPFYCACNMTIFQGVIEDAKNSSGFAKLTETTVICASPPHLKERKLVTITEHEMYCPVNLPRCPLDCVCSLREDNSTIIIDCQHLNITSFPDHLPDFTLELWFKNTSIQQILPRTYFRNVVKLDIRNSEINYISSSVFGQMKILRSLYLDSNLITTLPIEMTQLKLTALTLKHNPFICDCRIKWLKGWLLKNEAVVLDWEDVKCSDGSEKGTQLIALDDAEFTCREQVVFDSVRHVFLPSVVIGSLLFVFLVVFFLTYLQRMTIKILLYIYCGIHPFDIDITTNTENAEIFDAVAVYHFEDRDFVQKVVIDYLSDKGYKVVDMYRDFIVGLSFIENVKHFVANSRRLIMYLSANTLEDELMYLTWSNGYEKSVYSKTNYIILIEDNCNSSNVKDKQLRRYLKNRRYIKKRSPMFQERLSYFMPKTIDRPEVSQPFIRDTGVYIVYPDSLHTYVKNDLIPYIREKTKIDIGLFEFQYMPGNSLDEEILEVLENSNRLLYILSNKSLGDEIKMMILKNAIAKSMACDYNYLLFFTSGEIFESDLSRDVKNYINNHVTVQVEDTCFLQRLCTALTTEYSPHGETENFIAVEEGVNIPLV